MRNILITFFSVLYLNVSAQNLFSFSAGRTFGQYADFNETIQNFNASRPWLAEKLPLFNGSVYFNLTPSIRLADKWKLSIPFCYRRMSSLATNENFDTYLLFQHAQSHLMFEFYPRLAPDTLDPISPKFFFAFGFGASLLLPQVFINNEKAQVFDEDFQQLNVHFSSRVMFAYTIPLSHKIDLCPFLQFDLIPNFKAKDFDIALHGKRNENIPPALSILYTVGLRLQFRITPRTLEEDNLSMPY